MNFSSLRSASQSSSSLSSLFDPFFAARSDIGKKADLLIWSPFPRQEATTTICLFSRPDVVRGYVKRTAKTRDNSTGCNSTKSPVLLYLWCVKEILDVMISIDSVVLESDRGRSGWVRWYLRR